MRKTRRAPERIRTGPDTSRPYGDGVRVFFEVGAQVGERELGFERLAEPFFATHKRELGAGHRQVWTSRVAAHSAIFEFIEGWFNIRRPHSSLGYRSPTEHEAALTA